MDNESTEEEDYKPVVSQRIPASSAVPHILAVYKYCGGAGGCLHVVLDDNNVDHDSVEWCMQQHDLCDVCHTCGLMLLRLSITARKKAIALAWKHMRQERGY